jgi:hypothetical protein
MKTGKVTSGLGAVIKVCILYDSVARRATKRHSSRFADAMRTKAGS